MFALNDFSHGLDTSVFPPNLPGNALTKANNVLLRPLGFEKRPGYRRICTAAGDSATEPIMGLHIFVEPDGTRHIIRVQNATIEDFNSTSSTNWADVTNSLVVSEAVRTKMDVFRGYVVGTDSVNPIWKYDGGGSAAAITATFGGTDEITAAATLCVHRERLVLGDVTTDENTSTRYESLIWPSDAGTLDTFSASPTGRIHLGQGDGDSITAMVSLLGYLVVLKQHSIWRVSDHGASTQVALRVGNVGTASRFGAIVVDSLVYFLDPEFRLWSYDPRQGDSPDALTNITDQRCNLYERGALSEDTEAFGARGLVYWPDQRVILAFCGDKEFDSTPTTPNCAWAYHLDLNHARTKWNFLDDFKTYAYGLSDYSSHPALVLGSTDGYVARVLGNRTDDATGAISGTNTVIDMDARLAPTAMGDPNIYKELKWAYLYSSSLQTLFNQDTPTADTVTLQIIPVIPENVTSGDPLSFSISMPDQGDLYESVAEQRLNGYHRFVQFKVRHNSSRHFRFGALLIQYEPAGPRR